MLRSGAVVIGHPVAQVVMLSEELLSSLPVDGHAGADEPIDVGVVVCRAAASE